MEEYLSTRAGLEVLDILNELYESGELKNTISYFEERLKDIKERFSNLFFQDVGIGLMRGLRVENSDILSKIVKKSMENRVIILKAGRNTVRFLPPLVISKSEIDRGFERFEKAISAI